MDADKILAVALFVSVLAVLPQMECQLRPRPFPLPLSPPRPLPPPRPLCASQFALVNYACSMLPYDAELPVTPPSPTSPAIPPSPPPPLPDDDELVHHRHGHRHRHQGSHKETPEEERCCRWLKEVDNECVCDLLVRLPVFLARPVHEYTVIVDDSCNVTYSCSGRLRL